MTADADLPQDSLNKGGRHCKQSHQNQHQENGPGKGADVHPLIVKNHGDAVFQRAAISHRRHLQRRAAAAAEINHALCLTRITSRRRICLHMASAVGRRAFVVQRNCVRFALFQILIHGHPYLGHILGIIRHGHRLGHQRTILIIQPHQQRAVGRRRPFDPEKQLIQMLPL